MTQALQEHLGKFYDKHILQGQPLAVAAEELKKLLQSDPESKWAATTKLLELNALAASSGGDLSRRCFVSHIQRNALDHALNSTYTEADLTISQYAKQQAEQTNE